ncbi:MAG: hypothetical protein ACLP9L_01405 [Thermoguttaceae bacterium]
MTSETQRTVDGWPQSKQRREEGKKSSGQRRGRRLGVAGETEAEKPFLRSFPRQDGWCEEGPGFRMGFRGVRGQHGLSECSYQLAVGYEKRIGFCGVGRIG